jgi:diguanylate cyclase (GGDEF)-like protein
LSPRAAEPVRAAEGTQQLISDASGVLSAHALERIRKLVVLAYGPGYATSGSDRAIAIVEMPRGIGTAPVFCSDLLAFPQDAPRQLPADTRGFALLPLVGPSGACIATSDGDPAALGLCISSSNVEAWSRAKRQALELVARTVAVELELRARVVGSDRATEAPRRESLRDGLTELASHELFLDRVDLALKYSRRSTGRRFAVLSLKVDQFAEIQSTLGYETADDLLVEVARRLHATVREVDTVARFGRDEFLVLLDTIADDRDVARAAVRIGDALRPQIKTRWEGLTVSARIGIALGSTEVDGPGRLVQLAGVARERAKAVGSAYEIFDPVMHDRAITRIRDEGQLRSAVQAGAFELYYQPIIDLPSGRIAHFEALIRWKHAERGFIPPDQFLPLAEEMRLIAQIGWWVLAQACPQVGAWRKELGPDTALAVSTNITATQLLQPDLVERVKAILDDSNLPGEALILEITESTLIHDPEHVAAALTELRRLGIRIHLDDFGTGYSSLRYLLELPLDAIKIDRTFLAGSTDGHRKQQMVSTIRDLGRQLGLPVVAEGIEAQAQLQFIRQLECEFAQGFLFSIPLPAADASALLLQQPRWD